MSAAPLPPLGAQEKRELLRRLLAARAARAFGDAPLAPGQLALWFLQKFQPDSYAYNVAFAARLRPRVDADALRRALDALVARHAGLRTVFPERDGEPVQRVLPAGPAPLAVVDLGDASDDDALAAVTADYRRPFRLDQSPLAVAVYRRRDEDVLLVNVHHIAFDARSMQVVFEELRALYTAETGGARAALAPPPARYQDFVAWQAEAVAGARGEELWRYWQAALGDGPAPLEIAEALPRPAVVPLRGASEPFALPPRVAAGLRALAGSRQTTLYTVLLATMQVLLYQFGGQPDVTIGTPVSLRARAEWASVVGYFVNMLPVRGRVAGGSSFADQLTAARAAVLGALDHHEFPFPLTVDRLKVRREPNRSPIFQAVLNLIVAPRASGIGRMFDPGPAEPVPFGGATLTPFLFPQQQGQFEIALEVIDAGGALYGSLKYQTDLYTPETARRMRDAYGALLAAVVDDPHARVADLIAATREDFEL